MSNKETKNTKKDDATASDAEVGSMTGSMRGYAIYAGNVTSKSDGDRHFIGYEKLIQLYGLEPSKCFDGTKLENWLGRNRKECHIVRPDIHGRYNRFRQSNVTGEPPETTREIK